MSKQTDKLKTVFWQITKDRKLILQCPCGNDVPFQGGVIETDGVMKKPFVCSSCGCTSKRRLRDFKRMLEQAGFASPEEFCDYYGQIVLSPSSTNTENTLPEVCPRCMADMILAGTARGGKDCGRHTLLSEQPIDVHLTVSDNRGQLTTPLDVPMVQSLANIWVSKDDHDTRKNIQEVADNKWGKIPGVKTNTAVVLGAGFGVSALWLDVNTGGKTEIIAMEEDPIKYSILHKNIGKHSNIKAINAGVPELSKIFMSKNKIDIVLLDEIDDQEFFKTAPLNMIGLILWVADDKEATKAIIHKILGIRPGSTGSTPYKWDKLRSGAWRIGRPDWWNR